MYLISAEEYKNAGADFLRIKKAKKNLVKSGQKRKTYEIVYVFQTFLI